MEIFASNLGAQPSTPRIRQDPRTNTTLMVTNALKASRSTSAPSNTTRDAAQNAAASKSQADAARQRTAGVHRVAGLTTPETST
jgi:hypothetical protein